MVFGLGFKVYERRFDSAPGCTNGSDSVLFVSVPSRLNGLLVWGSAG